MRPPARLALVLAVAAAAAAQEGPPGVEALLAGARECVARAPRYDGGYVPLRYPGGDPGWARGACTDVVVRAFRRAGVDLQRLVHEDVAAAPQAYGIRRPDPSIDHRRVRNLVVFFARHAEELPPDRDWRPGDIVVWDLRGRGRPDHIGIVSDRSAPSGRPLVIHHFPPRPTEEDCLHRWRILHHFRWRWSGEG